MTRTSNLGSAEIQLQFLLLLYYRTDILLPGKAAPTFAPRDLNIPLRLAPHYSTSIRRMLWIWIVVAAAVVLSLCYRCCSCCCCDVVVVVVVVVVAPSHRCRRIPRFGRYVYMSSYHGHISAVVCDAYVRLSFKLPQWHHGDDSSEFLINSVWSVNFATAL